MYEEETRSKWGSRTKMAAGTWCRKGERTREKPVESRAIVTRFRDFARDTRRSVTSPCLAKFSAICFVLLGGDDHGTPIRNFRRANREFIACSRSCDVIVLVWLSCPSGVCVYSRNRQNSKAFSTNFRSFYRTPNRTRGGQGRKTTIIGLIIDTL